MISIIIPIYNAEQYLEQCIKSIINQSYKNWECILINDGSTDNSKYICNKWSIKDSRIKVIHQKNAGVSIARNKGIEISSGAYICFIDSDDWIEENFLKTMILHSLDCQLVVSGLIRDYIHRDSASFSPLYTKKISINNMYIKEILDLNEKALLYTPHEKLYCSNIIKYNKLKFIPNCNFGEDLIFNYQYLQFVKNISTISKAYYHYRILTDTLSSKFRENQFEEDYNQWLIIKKFHEEHNLINNESLEYLYKKLWGIIYDGLFLYPRLNIKSINYIYQILSIIEIKELKKHKNIFPCSIWIKNAIINRNAYIFYIYFTFFKKNNNK